MGKPLALLIMGIFVAILSACGGGGDSGGTSNGSNQSENVTATDSEVVANLKSSNIDFLPVISPVNRAPGTWRWPSTPAQHVLVYLPTPTIGNATEQDYATKTQNAVTQINQKLTGLLIIDVVSTAPSTGQYIQVSYGTSYVPAGSTAYQSFCANVATGPSIGNVIQPDSTNGINANPVYINIGNGHCTVTQDVIAHEFGHALGLANHFNGFGGSGPAISTAFWDVLATLYNNPQATIANNIIVKRATNLGYKNMKEITGVLKTLGSGSTRHGNVGSSFVKYNTIEIGDTLLQKVVSSQSLNDFVERGLGKEVTLFLNKNMLIGVKLPDGKIYFWKRSFLLFLYSVILSIFLLGFATVIGGASGNFIIPILVAAGLIFFTAKPFIMQTLVYQPKLSSLGGTALKG